jgi:hypothetical protein
MKQKGFNMFETCERCIENKDSFIFPSKCAGLSFKVLLGISTLMWPQLNLHNICFACALGQYLAAQSSSKCMALKTSHDNER